MSQKLSYAPTPPRKRQTIRLILIATAVSIALAIGAYREHQEQMETKKLIDDLANHRVILVPVTQP